MTTIEMLKKSLLKKMILTYSKIIRETCSLFFTPPIVGKENLYEKIEENVKFN